ncbi:3-oxo-behenoyl-CoA reductase [Aureococcus anophagefferens]|nr:3-oxo-behenoyl-CoA reductase [Aureococcus anophagefferens]
MGLRQLLVCAAAAVAASQEWAVVTGASSGIGAALAQRAAAAGYGVVLHGRDRAALRRVGEGLGPDATWRVVVVDLATPSGAKKLHGACRGLDVALLLANAGAADGLRGPRGHGRRAVFKVPARAGVVSAPDDVARAAFSRTGREVVPGLANRAYALATEALPNAARASRLSRPSPKFGALASSRRRRGRGRTRREAAAAGRRRRRGAGRGVAALAARGRRRRQRSSAGSPRERAAERAPRAGAAVELDDEGRVRVDVESLAPPETVDGEWDGELEFLGGPPLNGFITNRLFTVGGGRWLGKAFGPDGDGANRFAGGVAGRPFRYAVEASRLDGKPALVLNYAAAGDRLWGTTLRMRDELRELEPGVLLGLGSMAGTGGMRNNAPFVLRLADPA